MTLEYSIEVYKDHAIVRGSLTAAILIALVTLCKEEGFKYMQNIGDGTQGFKFVKGDS